MTMKKVITCKITEEEFQKTYYQLCMTAMIWRL
jgi:hypothetical protein